MVEKTFSDMFIDLLREIFDSESQILAQFPPIIDRINNSLLKATLEEHLKETQIHLDRLTKIFSLLCVPPIGGHSQATTGLFLEGTELVNKEIPLKIKDSYFIVFCQKLEHLKIANYGSACALARHLKHSHISEKIDFDEIIPLLIENLKEAKVIDAKLTDIAEGSFFSVGLNDEAEIEAKKSGVKL